MIDDVWWDAMLFRSLRRRWLCWMMRVGQDCETGDCSLHPQTCVWLFLSNKRTLVEGEGKNTL